MTKEINNFINLFEGNWVTKTSIYFIKSRSNKINDKSFSLIFLNSGLDLLNYCLTYQQYRKQHYFSIDYRNQYIQKKQNNYSITKINKNIMHIFLFNKQLKLVYHEYLHSINPNLKVSIGKIKKKQKYWAIIVTSYIRQN